MINAHTIQGNLNSQQVRYMIILVGYKSNIEREGQKLTSNSNTNGEKTEITNVNQQDAASNRDLVLDKGKH